MTGDGERAVHPTSVRRPASGELLLLTSEMSRCDLVMHGCSAGIHVTPVTIPLIPTVPISS